MKTCVICNQERTPASFSTLARWRSAVVRKSELESVACTSCYWMQLITHYPQLRVTENGRCTVVYMRRERPRWEYVTEVQDRLPLWKKDENTVEAYGFLGLIDEQIRPFLDWAETARQEFEAADREVGNGRLTAQAPPEPSAEGIALTVRLYTQMRKTAVIDAIKYEIVKRNNQLVACQTPGVRPLIQTHSRENAMEHARATELKLLDVLGL